MAEGSFSTDEKELKIFDVAVFKSGEWMIQLANTVFVSVICWYIYCFSFVGFKNSTFNEMVGISTPPFTSI